MSLRVIDFVSLRVVDFVSLRVVVAFAVCSLGKSNRVGERKVSLLKSCCWERVCCLDMWGRGMSSIWSLVRMVDIRSDEMRDGFVLRTSLVTALKHYWVSGT